jgi:uncharacterized protein YkwD
LALCLSLASCDISTGPIDAEVDLSLLGGGDDLDAWENQLESHMALDVNAARRAEGVAELPTNYDVSGVARSHSLAMRVGQFFEHQDLSGHLVEDRLADGDVLFDRAGEVIGFSTATDGVTQADLDEIHAELMSDANTAQRLTILDPDWTEMGIGVSVAPNQRSMYVTEVFIEYPGHVIGVK